MKIVIVGGVAGGASAAARARRLSESAEIIMIERGNDPSFANCGMPYYVGGTIESRKKLLVSPIEMLRKRYGLDVRIRQSVESIDRQAKQIRIKRLETGEEYTESYDKLILAPGAAPFKPPIPGIDLPGIYTLRNLDDADRLASATSKAKRAAIIGAGFIGIEMAENLSHRGLETSVVELNSRILPPWDGEMIAPLEELLTNKGVKLYLGAQASEFRKTDAGLEIVLSTGETIEADFVVLSIGVRPENSLAVDADLSVAARGGIQVNAHQQTNDPDIYAVGDAIEVVEVVSGQPVQIPLAGPANRQGRIAADHIFGRDSSYRGTQGTAIVGLWDYGAAMTGLSEKACQRMGLEYEKIYLHPGSHAGYYPGAQTMAMKLVFDPKSGKILGGQIVGKDSIDKRTDVLAMAIQAGMTVEDLEEAELSYAPQYGSAKDPVNMAGFIAAGVMRGDQPVAHSTALVAGELSDVLLLDVRTAEEFAAGSIPDAKNIPLDSLRDHLDDLPKDQPIVAYCKVGMRGYMATRILLQNGFDVRNLSGGYTTYCQVRNAHTK